MSMSVKMWLDPPASLWHATIASIVIMG